MPKKALPFSAWVSEVFFEDNAHFRRRAPRLGLISKIIKAIPQTFAFTFTNFASTQPKAGREPQPHPVPPAVGLHLTLDQWPEHPTREAARGLPFSDDVASLIDAGTALESVSDLVFAMRELHRVCSDGALITARVSAAGGTVADPTALRTINRAALLFFCDHPVPPALAAKAERLGVRGLFAMDDESDATIRLRVRKAGATPLRTSRIDIGSGSSVQPGYTGVDIVALPNVQTVCDVDRHGLPFSDSTISHVYTAHFLEHVADLVFVMNEIHRVCCQDGIVEVHVPTLMGPYAAADPTHRRLFNARTLSYFEAGSDGYAGIEKGFEILEQRVGLSIYARLRVIK
jgi:ubiquinone/menaquinone biosynthesis C-methylase UbiE